MLPLRDNIPTVRLPIVTIVLIALNVAVFAWELTFSTQPGSANSAALARAGASARDQTIIEYGAIPREITHHTSCVPYERASGEPVCAEARTLERAGVSQPPWIVTVFIAMFMHGGWLHIAGNMLFLWIFGSNVEDAMGRLKFVLFYLLGGLAAMAAQVAVDPGSTAPTIGASGAIAAVMGGYALLYPRARVLTVILLIFFFTLIEIPALVVLAVWFAMQFVPAISQLATPVGEGGGVAYFAHVGGFIFGLALIRLFARRRRDLTPEPRFPVY